MTQTSISSAEIQRMGGLSAFLAQCGTCTAWVPAQGRTYSTEKMNGLEASYAAYLETLRSAGKILAWKYEPLKVKLADRTECLNKRMIYWYAFFKPKE